MTPRLSRWSAPLVALAVSACIGTSIAPQTLVPPAAAGPFAALPVAPIEAVPDDWWRLYDDPQLDALVEASLAANADLRVAYANLDGARAAPRRAAPRRAAPRRAKAGAGREAADDHARKRTDGR
jgi:outer membrane protein TolC